MAVLVVQALKKSGSPARAVFPLFLIIFSLMYLFSRFSDRQQARYLYALYFCLPVLLAAPFLMLTRLGIPYDKKVTGDRTLFYNIQGPVFPDVLDGTYVQHVQFRLPTSAVVERDLHDGPNTIELEISGAEARLEPRLVTMRFRYRCRFDFAALRTISAVLENVKLSE